MIILAILDRKVDNNREGENNTTMLAYDSNLKTGPKNRSI